jgi:hypothetical protein
MKIIHLISSLSILLLAASSCEIEEIPQDELPEFIDKIVVNSFIANDEPVVIETSQAAGAYTEDVPPRVDDINLELTLNGDEVILTYDAQNQVYVSSVTPKTGDELTLVAFKEGYQTANAFTRVPTGVQGKESGYIEDGGVDQNGVLSDLLWLKLQDNADENNFYELNFYYFNTTIQQYVSLDFEINDDILKDPSTLKLNNGGFVFSDESFNGEEVEFNAVAPFGLVISNPDEKYLVELKHLSADYFKYLVTLQDYRDQEDLQTGGPFGSAVIVHSNVNNGLGIFASAYNLSDTLR